MKIRIMKIRIMKIITVVYLFLLPFASFSACIAVVTAGGGHAFWREVADGARAAAKSTSYSIYARGPSEANVMDAQLHIIDDALRRDCKGFVLAPATGEELAEKVNALVKIGTPVAIIDRDFKGNPSLGPIKTDGFKAGIVAGKKLLEKIGDNGKVAILHEGMNVGPTAHRVKGFIEALRGSKVKIEVNEAIGTTIGEARDKIRALQKLNSFANISGIFTPNEFTTIATAVTKRKLKMANKIVQVGFDVSPTIRQAIKNGEIYGVVVQDAFQIGFKGVERVLNALQGKIDNSVVSVPVEFLTKNNL